MLNKLYQLLAKSIIPNMSTKKPIISIVGTTGVGKSQFSIDLARAIGGEIINADSMQVYQKLDQITNKHPLDERMGVPHHVIDYVPWDEDYHIHKFNQDAQSVIDDIHNRGKIPIVVGGTHYYLQTLLFNNKTIDDSNSNLKELTAEQLEILDGPVDILFRTLQEVDPIIAKKFHPQDHRKLRRALEIFYTKGEKASEIYHEQKLDELDSSSLKYNTLFFWVYCDPEILNDRLDKRVDKMMENGAIEEIKEMYDFYKSKQEQNLTCTSGIWQVIGFKEFLLWLEDNQSDTKLFEHGIERMKIRTKQYARYQVKWIKKSLLTELEKESKFDFVNGGKLYILDATNLDNWHENVDDIGIQIAQDFLSKGANGVSLPQAPDELKHFFEAPNEIKSNRRLESQENWKHFVCDICKDKQGNALVAVGEDSWSVHVNSRRHKKNEESIKKRKHNEEMIRLKKMRSNQEGVIN
ncbi:tRNA delta 2 -isopentenylpyrophosphate transferase [Candida albicans]|nr:tRNA dimethylallyltransferase [Candida albicans P87]KGU32129.1 tRNA dimethylallyltransferase [Candida albicans P34048]KHC83687.1 tRNA dimethylallyltransferase [Candida albicans SC5314]